MQQQMGFFRMNVPMEYPFLPIVQSFNENELIVNGLEQVHLFFPSEVQVDTVLSDKVVDVVDLFSSSNNSGIMEGRFMLIQTLRIIHFYVTWIKVASSYALLQSLPQVVS